MIYLVDDVNEIRATIHTQHMQETFTFNAVDYATCVDAMSAALKSVERSSDHD